MSEFFTEWKKPRNDICHRTANLLSLQKATDHLRQAMSGRIRPAERPEGLGLG